MIASQPMTQRHLAQAVLVAAVLGVTLAPQAEGGTAQAAQSWYVPVGRGFYEVLAPGGGRAWLLPPSGTQDACRPGDARDVRWSADGQRIAATVDDGTSLTLCLYQLKASWVTRETRRVRVERPSAMKFGESGTSSALQALDKAMGGGERRAYTEHEVAWVPEILAPGNVSSYPAPIAFTNGREEHPARIFGLKGIDFGPGCESIPLDGQSRFETPNTRPFYQPAWVPDISGGRARGLGLAEVTQRGVTCGTERIVYLPKPVCDAVEDCNPDMVELANACSMKAPRAAVRFPSWAPTAENEAAFRLAFVRVAPGAGQRVCVRTGPLGQDEAREVCYGSRDTNKAVSRLYPTWSSDGRFLAYFEVTPPAADPDGKTGGKPIARIKIVDTAAGPSGQVSTLLTGVRTNPEHGPPILTIDGTPWVFAITSADGTRYDRVTAVAVGAASRRTVLLDPGLQNLKAVDVATFRGSSQPEVRLSIVAQGFRDMVKADQTVDKVFVYAFPPARLEQPGAEE